MDNEDNGVMKVMIDWAINRNQSKDESKLSKDESKLMIEPPATILEDPTINNVYNTIKPPKEILLPEVELIKQKVLSKKTDLKHSTNILPPRPEPKSLHPVALVKHKTILSGKPPGTHKYYKSK